MRLVSRSVSASIIVSILGIGSLSAATYYVSPSGNDARSGRSPQAAWRSVAKVNTIEFQAGDKVLFEGGQAFAGRIYLDASDRGTAERPIVISSFGAGRATIRAGRDNGLLAYNTAGIVVRNINFVGDGPTVNTRDGVSFYADLPGNVKLAGITIDRVRVGGFGNTGVSVGSWNQFTGFRDVRIVDVSAHDNLHAGIATYAQVPNVHANVKVIRCVAFRNFGNPASSGNTGSGIVLGGVVQSVIRRCVAYNNGRNNFAPTEGPVGIWTYDSSHVLIQFNEAYANRTGSGRDGGGFDLDINVRNSVMQYNYSHDNDGAGFLVYGDAANNGNVVRYNISQNDGRKNGYGGIHVAGPVAGAEIYNNTIYMSPASGGPAGIRIEGAAANVRLRNNIIYTTGGARLVEIAGSAPGLVFRGNCFFAANGAFGIVQNSVNYSSLEAWRAGTGQENFGQIRTGWNVDPQLVAPGGGGTLNNAAALSGINAYKLRGTSPLIDRGLWVNATPPNRIDFYGTPLPQGGAVDVGAHERVAAP